MFNSMKNQLREKTGRDLPKFTPQKGGLSRQSRQGSESSVSSLILEGNQQQSSSTPAPSQGPANQEHSIKLTDGKVLSNKEVNLLARKEDEWRHRLEKKEAEFNKMMDKKDAELFNTLSLKEGEWRLKEQALTEELLKQTNELKDALKTAEEYKRKLCQFQEDKDTIEGFQTQEMAKVKHLLLAKEKECNETSIALKEATALLESLKSEVSRLQPFEEQVSNYQDEIDSLTHSSEREKRVLKSKLIEAEEDVRHLRDRVDVLSRRNESDAGLVASWPVDDRLQAFLGERALLERRLEEAHVHLTDIKASWSAQIASLETQVGRLSRQAGEEGAERRLAEAKVAELEAKLEDEIKERERLSGRVLSLTEECNNLSAELKAANSLVVSKDEDISELTKKIYDSEICSSKNLEERNYFETELLRVQSKLKEVEEELSALKLSVFHESDQLQKELVLKSEKVASLENELERERTAKDEALLRNIQVSQEVDMVRQEIRQQQGDIEDYIKKVNTLEVIAENKEQELSRVKTDFNKVSEELCKIQDSERSTENVEKGLRDKIADLEEQVTDKNKAIKIMKQKMTDMKKTIQRELKASDGEGLELMNNHNHAIPTPSNLKENGDTEVNFLYMKNVIMKFLTSREYEALHLTRAVATLLKLSAEEECLLKDTIGWRMSWFGSKPRLEDYTPS